MEGLRDIKDIVEIHEYSLWILSAWVLVALVLAWILYILYKNRRIRRKKPTARELALQRLKAIDFTDTKQAVYTFTVDGSQFVNDENREHFQKIVQRLDPYKYQKEVPPLPENEKADIEAFIRRLS